MIRDLVSIIITVNEFKESLFTTINSIDKSNHKNTEKIILFKRSCDLANFIRNSNKIPCLLLSESISEPEKLNRILKTIDGEYVMFLNENCSLYPDGITNLITRLKNTNSEGAFGKAEIPGDNNRHILYPPEFFGFDQKNLYCISSARLYKIESILRTGFTDKFGNLFHHDIDLQLKPKFTDKNILIDNSTIKINQEDKDKLFQSNKNQIEIKKVEVIPIVENNKPAKPQEKQWWEAGAISLLKENDNLKIASYQCIVDGKDKFEESIKDPKVDYFLFVDNPENYKSNHTKILPLPEDDYKDIHKSIDGICETEEQRTIALNLLKSQKVRVLAPTTTELRKYDLCIYIDGNMHFKVPPFNFIKKVLDSQSLLYIFDHPDRNCIYEEVKEWDKLNKYFPKARQRTLKRYESLYFPKNYGFHGGGVQIKDLRGGMIFEFLYIWWNDILDYTASDQLSLPYLRWCHNFPVKSVGKQFNEEFQTLIQTNLHLK